jgi:hypothetical protein
MWDRLLAIVVEKSVPLEEIYGDVSRRICTQSLVFIEQPEEIRLQFLFNVWKLPTNALILISFLFHSVAPTCFGTYVPSSGSSSVPAE